MISDHTQRLNAPLKKSKNPHLKAEGGESNLAPSLTILQLFLQFSGEKLRISKPVNGKLTGTSSLEVFYGRKCKMELWPKAIKEILESELGSSECRIK